MSRAINKNRKPIANERRFTIIFPTPLFQQLCEVAERDGRTASSLGRNLIKLGLAKMATAPDPFASTQLLDQAQPRSSSH